MNNKKKYGFIFGLLFVIVLLGVLFIDVQPIGPEDSTIGFASINNWFFTTMGVNSFWYELSEIIGYIALLFAALFGCIGIYQLVKGKSLKKVDKGIFNLGVLYVVMGIFYILFEKVVINYRPVLIDGVLEASFPSSHTMLGCVILGSALMIIPVYVKNKKTLKITQIIILSLLILLVLARLLSGVHWFTDIVAGILLSLTMVSFYNPKKR